LRPQIMEGDTYLWLYNQIMCCRPKRKACKMLQACCRATANMVALPLQPACTTTAKSLQRHCNRLAAKL
ncbi:hypothetical protein, partial [Bacteroides heparinolyticus]|uniref:hypothetical protein n=1 Tax=Prevotella heparinolytica TaxID=28113 RepID=UPI0035A0D64E